MCFTIYIDVCSIYLNFFNSLCQKLTFSPKIQISNLGAIFIFDDKGTLKRLSFFISLLKFRIFVYKKERNFYQNLYIYKQRKDELFHNIFCELYNGPFHPKASQVQENLASLYSPVEN